MRFCKFSQPPRKNLKKQSGLARAGGLRFRNNKGQKTKIFFLKKRSSVCFFVSYKWQNDIVPLS